MGINKIWVNQHFLICYDYIKNHLYINWDDGTHIELSDLVTMQQKHTMSYIFHKILVTGLPVSKI